MRVPDLQKTNSLMTIEQSLAILPGSTTLSSSLREWGSLSADVMPSCHAIEVLAPAMDHHSIVISLGGSELLHQKFGDRASTGMISGGDVTIYPAYLPYYVRGDTTDSLILKLPDLELQAAIEALGTRSGESGGLQYLNQTKDATVGHFGDILLSELRQAPHPAQRLLVDSIGAALACHLLRSYNLLQSLAQNRRKGLTPHTLKLVVSYIEDNVQRSISLEDLSSVANVSRFHFARMFRSSTGSTPMAFVEMSRLRRGEDLIRQSKLPLNEIASLLGFTDQSHFGRRFRAKYGITPGQMARDHRSRR